MLLRFSFFLIVLPQIAWYWFGFHYFPEFPIPTIENDDYFGAGNPRADNEIISDYAISVDQKRVMDFKNGIRKDMEAAPESLEEANFELGVNVNYLRSLNKSFEIFDWKQHEHFLNTFKHFR